MNYLIDHNIGVHLPKRKVLSSFFDAANELDITTFACFTAPNLRYSFNTTFQNNELDMFLAKKAQKNYHIFSHAGYLINIADKNKTIIYENSVRALETEIDRCHTLGIQAIAFHPGSNINRKEGLHSIAETINTLSILDQGDTILCIESSAGQGNTLPTTFQEMAFLMKHISNKRKVGFALDTCHLFAAGYDLSTKKNVDTNLSLFDSLIGLDHVIFLHLNDSLKPLGSHLDRHQTIGKGYIGIQGITAIILHEKIKKKPKILETPVNQYLDWKNELTFINKIYENQ